MNRKPHRSRNLLITKMRQFFSRDLALKNDYVRQENKILRSKLGARAGHWALGQVVSIR